MAICNPSQHPQKLLLQNSIHKQEHTVLTYCMHLYEGIHCEGSGVEDSAIDSQLQTEVGTRPLKLQVLRTWGDLKC